LRQSPLPVAAAPIAPGASPHRRDGEAGADIKFDGNLYAHVLFSTGVSDQTRYLHPDGTSLSSQEIASVNALLDRVVVANFLWSNLAYP
jgi:hypothetical protein